MTNQKALAAFMQHKSKLDALLNRLTEASADHFDWNPEDINYGHVGSIAFAENKLREVIDFLYPPTK